MSPDRLIYMANQIGKYFESQHRQNAVDGIADHLRKFWDPSMRRTISAYAKNGGEGLDPVVLQAVRALSGVGPT
jgi:formate dehydrogenase subunit delta